jgi:RNA 2',3'-cyclic 3'-phosphodiesterase
MVVEQIRSFIAIELPDEVKLGLKNVQEILMSVDPACAKWVDPAGMHLTLKFLGNVNADIINSIVNAMKEATRGIPPFCFELKNLGAFPNLRRVQIVWIGVVGDLDILSTLQKNLDTALSPLGFTPENRSFTPHLTLARLRENVLPLKRLSLGELIAKTKFDSNIVITANSISLMKSQLTRSGAIYTRLDSVKLSHPC